MDEILNAHSVEDIRKSSDGTERSVPGEGNTPSQACYNRVPLAELEKVVVRDYTYEKVPFGNMPQERQRIWLGLNENARLTIVPHKQGLKDSDGAIY